MHINQAGESVLFVIARRKCRSPGGTIRPRHSSLIDRTNRSACASGDITLKDGNEQRLRRMVECRARHRSAFTDRLSQSLHLP